MENSIIEYGETLKKIGGELVRASKDLSFTIHENSDVILVKLEREVLLLESVATELESVSPPKVIDKEHLELLDVFKDLAEGKKYLMQFIKSNAGIITCNKFSNVMKDINKKGELINNISTSLIIKLLNN